MKKRRFIHFDMLIHLALNLKLKEAEVCQLKYLKVEENYGLLLTHPYVSFSKCRPPQFLFIHVFVTVITGAEQLNSSFSVRFM